VLLLTLFTKQEASYFTDMHAAYVAGALDALGTHCTRAEAYFRRHDDAYNDALWGRVEALLGRGWGQVYVLRAWDAAVLQRVAGMAPGARVLPFERLDQARLARELATARPEARTLAHGLGHDPLWVLLAVAPHLEVELVNPDFRPAREWLTLFGDPSCVWRRDVTEEPSLAGCALPADGTVERRGCSFCTLSKARPRLPRARVWPVVKRQLERLARLRPGARDFIVQDQAPLGFLPELLRLASDLGLAGATFHLQGRADVYLKRRRLFEACLDQARERGLKLSPYLVGIENFSDRELAILHKGTTGARNLAFLEALDAWRARFGEALAMHDLTFGFLLWNPWTRMEDLRLNLEVLQRVRMHRFRGDEIVTRLRLYPSLPLHHKAAADGLLLPAYEHAFLSSAARYGYEAEQPWRHADLKVQRAAELTFDLYEARKPIDQYAFLGLVLEFVEGLGAEALERWTHEQRVDAFLHRHGAAIDALVKASGAGERAPGGHAETSHDAARERARALVTRVVGAALSDPAGTAVAGVELGAELRLRLANGLTLTLAAAGAGPALVRGRTFDAGYVGDLPAGVGLDDARSVMSALLARLDSLQAGEREALLAALAARAWRADNPYRTKPDPRTKP
jgi:hypothetical protein